MYYHFLIFLLKTTYLLNIIQINFFCIKFENITDNEPFLLQNNFNKVKINKKYYYLIKKSDNTNILWFKQHAFIKYITILKYITI